MTATSERTTNPRNLFLALSLAVICCGASVGLGTSLPRLSLVLAGAGLCWIYSFLTFCDPHSHADYVQNGNAAVAFIAVYAAGSSGQSGALFVWASSFTALIVSELAGAFITGSKRGEFPVMGSLLTVMAAISAAMIYLSRKTGPSGFLGSALTGWALPNGGAFFAAAMWGILCAAGALVYLAGSTLQLYSHGPIYFNASRREYLAIQAAVIIGKALVLSLAFSLVGVFGGVGYYLMTLSRSGYSRAESLAASFLLAVALSACSLYCGWASAAGSVLVSTILFLLHGRNAGNLS